MMQIIFHFKHAHLTFVQFVQYIYTDYRARYFFSPFVQISFHLQAKKSLSIAFNECRKYFCPKESYLDKKEKVMW